MEGRWKKKQYFYGQKKNNTLKEEKGENNCGPGGRVLGRYLQPGQTSRKTKQDKRGKGEGNDPKGEDRSQAAQTPEGEYRDSICTTILDQNLKIEGEGGERKSPDCGVHWDSKRTSRNVFKGVDAKRGYWGVQGVH